MWGVEADFREIPGAIDTRVGYVGGTRPNPTYRDVSGTTGYAEAMEIMYDSAALNRQGPDIGTQYRSAIFYTTDDQHTAAEQSKATHQSILSRPIVTQIAAAAPFWPAEDYHQRYLEKQGVRTCRV